MKQGRASPDGPAGRKVEPTPHGIRPGYADQLGQKMLHDALKTPMGAPAMHGPTPTPQRPGPGGGRTVHPSGSQRRY